MRSKGNFYIQTADLLKVWETIEIRTRMETRVGVRPTIDAFGNISMETYTYQEEVEYEYKILNVLLKNKGFDTIARKNMNRKQTGRYDAYSITATINRREDISSPLAYRTMAHWWGLPSAADP